MEFPVYDDDGDETFLHVPRVSFPPGDVGASIPATVRLFLYEYESGK